MCLIFHAFHTSALHRLHGNIARTIYVDEDVALKLHFKSECLVELQNEECSLLKASLIADTSLDKFASVISAKTTEVWKMLYDNDLPIVN